MSLNHAPLTTQRTPKSPATSPTFSHLLSLTLPMMGLMLCHLGISLTDLWVAGKIDTSVLASLGIISQIFVIMMLMASLAGGGALAAISQSLGANKTRRACRYAGLILVLGFGSGASVGLVVFIFSPYIFHLFTVKHELLPIIQTFTTAYCVQLPFYYCLILSNSIFRAYTMVWRPFITFTLVLILNFGWSTGFGLGWWDLPVFGYAGIAWATVAATIVGLLINLAICFQKEIVTKHSFAPWRWNKKAMPYIFRVGTPTALAQLASQGANVLLLSLITLLPGETTSVLAGYTLGLRLTSLALFPLGALSLSIGIISGHLLGAGKHDNLYSFGLKTALKSMGVFCLISTFLYIYKFELSNLFNQEPHVMGIASSYLSMTCLALPFTAFSAIITGVYSGAGATYYSGAIQIGTSWGIRLPLAWLLGYGCGLGFVGIFIAFPISSILEALAVFWVYQKKSWFQCSLRPMPKKNKDHTPRAYVLGNMPANTK